MKLRLKSKARWAFATLGFVGLVFLAIGFEGPLLGDPVLSPNLVGRGLVNVHSNSNRRTLDGSQYNEW